MHCLKLINTAVLAASLVACGGGTDVAAPVAAPTQETTGNQLAASVAIGQYASVSLAKETVSAGTTQTAGLTKFLNWVAGKIIPNAYAQTADQCNYDLLKLAGVNADGSLDKLNVTTGADDCASGFIDMYDGKRYLLMTASGIYKDGLTCNLVLINKQTGSMYCVGERSRSIYAIANQSNWQAYEKLQVSDSGNYIYLEADSTVFDMNGQITGKKTKLIRFDLTNDEVGPVSSTVVEGFQQSWLSGMYENGNSEYEGFSIKGFQALNGGDLAMLYERWISTGQTWSSKLNGHYYTFDSAGKYTRVPFDGAAIGRAVDAANAQKSSGYTNSIAASNWYNISCFFKDETDSNSFLFTVPYYWYSNANNTWNNGTSSVILKGSKPAAADTTMPVAVVTGDSAICASDSYAAPGMGGGTSLRPSKIGDTYYALQTVYGNYMVNGSMRWGQRLYLVGNKFDGAADTQKLVSASNEWWGGSNQLYATKTKLIIQLPPDWSGVAPDDRNQPGNRLWLLDPNATFTYTDGTVNSSTYNEIIATTDYLSISKMTTSPLTEEFSFTARDLGDDDLKKLIVEVDSAGTVSRKPGTTQSLEAISVIKL
jgi:hypothetical protein